MKAVYLEWETKFPISGRALRAVGPLVMVRQLPILRLSIHMRNWLSCKAQAYSQSWTQKNLHPSDVRRLCLSLWLSDLAHANSLINLWSSASMQVLDEREWKKGWSLDQQQHEDSQDDSLPNLTTASKCLTEQLKFVSVPPILLASSLVWKEPPADWSDIIKRPLFSNVGCIQNCLWQSCLHPHNYLILLECGKLAWGTRLGVHGKSASFSIDPEYLYTWSCKDGTKVHWRRACSFWLELRSDLTDELRAEMTGVYLGDSQWTAPKLNGFVILFLTASLSLFLRW